MADEEYSYASDYCKQKERRAVSAFKKLIGTPATGAFTMPAGARLSFSSAAGSAAGDTLVSIVGTSNRTIKSKGLAANVKQTFDFAERGVVITPSTGVAVFVDQGLARWAKIAQG